MSADPVPLVKYRAHFVLHHGVIDRDQSDAYKAEAVDAVLAARDETLNAFRHEVEACRDLMRRDAAFQEWAQGYLDGGKWAGHDRSDAVKAELLKRDAEVAARDETIAQLRGQVEAKEERARYYLRENQALGKIVAAVRRPLADAQPFVKTPVPSTTVRPEPPEPSQGSAPDGVNSRVVPSGGASGPSPSDRGVSRHSTREIVCDAKTLGRLGHNPSWVKAADYDRDVGALGRQLADAQQAAREQSERVIRFEEVYQAADRKHAEAVAELGALRARLAQQETT